MATSTIKKDYIFKTLSSGDDLNNIKTTGLYYITSGVSNTPDNVTYTAMLCYAASSSAVFQFVFGSTTKSRKYIGSTPTWREWV